MKNFLKRQRELQIRGFGYDPTEMHGEERAEFIRWNCLAAIKELTEMLDQVDGWKPWQNRRENAGAFKSRAEYIEEGVDVLHFVGNLLLTAGVEDDALDAMYHKKQKVNRQRQEDGYAGVGKEHVHA